MRYVQCTHHSTHCLSIYVDTSVQISSQISLHAWLAQSERTKQEDHASLELLLQKLNQDQVAMLDLLNVSDTKQDTLLTMIIALQQASALVVYTFKSPV
jgi:hypothetical protein